MSIKVQVSTINEVISKKTLMYQIQRNDVIKYMYAYALSALAYKMLAANWSAITFLEIVWVFYLFSLTNASTITTTMIQEGTQTVMLQLREIILTLPKP